MLPEYFGPYKIEKIIGQGGMGNVYKAFHAKSGLTVAVKVISSSIANEVRFRRRFEAEIETLKRLKHPNIVQLIGYGEENGNLFYSMEYVEGESLHECLKKNGPVPWEDALRIGIDISSALKHAHDMGIIHRDLKPANLLINHEGTIKLVDFGIAKLFGATEMTMAGSIVGTADFMSPEQADGKPATPRSDLYSLGSVLYAAVTGRAPFAGKSVPETLYALKFTDPIPLCRMTKDTPVELAELIEQLLQKDPSLRPPTALVVNNRMKSMQQGLKKRIETNDLEQIGSLETHTSLDLNEFQERLIDLPLGTSDRLTIDARESLPDQPTDPTLLARPQTMSDVKLDLNLELLHASVTSESQKKSESQRTSDSQISSGPGTEVTSGGGTHFTTVGDKSHRHSSSFEDELQTEGNYNQLISVAMIVIALIACISALWYLSRPPSAEDLFAEFATDLEADNIEQLSAKYDSLVAFERQYPADARVEVVRAAIQEIETDRRIRSLLRRSRRESASPATSVMEDSIFEAIQLGKSEPDKSLRLLQAILAVYGSKQDLSPSQLELLQIVESKQRLLKQYRSQYDSDARKELNQLISWGIGNLKGAELSRFLEGIIELYAKKDWAAAEVQRAQDNLNAQPR